MKKFVWMLALLLPLFCVTQAERANAANPVYRAAVIGEGAYTRQSSLSPGPENDVKAVRDMFKRDSRYASVKELTNQGASKLAASLQAAFKDAKDGDVSVFYYSGHGDARNGEAELVFTDNIRVTGSQLKAMLDQIKGTKVIIVDACYSGALIGKGEGEGGFAELFLADMAKDSKGGALSAQGYQVLVAASEREESLSLIISYGATAGKDMGMFTRAMVQGAGDSESGGRYLADANVDGDVTLAEMRDYTRRNFAVFSNAQCYPENSAFSLVKYTPTEKNKPVITKLAFSAEANPSPIAFTFTTNAAVQMNASILAVNYTESGNLRYDLLKQNLFSVDQTVKAGSQYSGSWDGSLDLGKRHSASDYYLIFRMKGMTAWQWFPFTYTNAAKPVLQMTVNGAVSLSTAQESAIAVRYSSDCLLNVVVTDQNDKTVRVLANLEPATQYGRFESTGSQRVNLFYWDGKDNSGKAVAPGTYKLWAQARYGGNKFSAVTRGTVEVAK